VDKLLVREGRKFTDPYANEILIDRWIADEEALSLGDELVAFPYANAPEGTRLTVVGYIEGVSLGTAVIPLETGRNIFGMYDGATGANVISELAPEALEEALWTAPNVESVFGMQRAIERVEANFEGSELVLTLSLFMAIGIAVIFLGILAALDAADRAPDLAVLQSIGWRDRALLTLCLSEVMARGVAALAVALPLAPLIAHWLMGRIGEANHYEMELVQPLWLLGLVIGLGLALMPLGALPALRAAKQVTPARAVRMLTRE
jgi:ABC-type lipoprotein release transport system permease subunit